MTNKGVRRMNTEFKIGMFLYADLIGGDNRPLRGEVYSIEEKKILGRDGEEKKYIYLNFCFQNIKKKDNEYISILFREGSVEAKDIGKHIFCTEEEASEKIEKIEKLEEEIKERQNILKELKQ